MTTEDEPKERTVYFIGPAPGEIMKVLPIKGLGDMIPCWENQSEADEAAKLIGQVAGMTLISWPAKVRR